MVATPTSKSQPHHISGGVLSISGGVLKISGGVLGGVLKIKMSKKPTFRVRGVKPGAYLRF